jgi:Asp-tRNA(Asn)/Glu-tRNA(Gln) amidotransferase C subunit
MAITREDVLHVAALARLEIPRARSTPCATSSGRSSRPSAGVELDLTEVAPMTHPSTW